jgi:hypothetical protein
VVGDTEVDAGALARTLLEQRHHQPVHRGRQQRAAEHHRVALVLVAQRVADLLGDTRDVAQVEAAVRPRSASGCRRRTSASPPARSPRRRWPAAGPAHARRRSAGSGPVRRSGSRRR